ncbi:hypothetical protein K443DRAFT_224469 [Laccaria amethystina LaAM-08-1]|uniref:Uncharacterized protein n=1 Tax=Laccaria amethystina LaAM-08-1 TaxID=1095629 RepID=A0A0C9WM91_9AGAR|nr:hypothetical protein K443DRAFT_224469 [Laccaria amethystina LaAM-08-1]
MTASHHERTQATTSRGEPPTNYLYDTESRWHVADRDVATKRRTMTEIHRSLSLCNLGHRRQCGMTITRQGGHEKSTVPRRGQRRGNQTMMNIHRRCVITTTEQLYGTRTTQNNDDVSRSRCHVAVGDVATKRR